MKLKQANFSYFFLLAAFSFLFVGRGGKKYSLRATTFTRNISFEGEFINKENIFALFALPCSFFRRKEKKKKEERKCFWSERAEKQGRNKGERNLLIISRDCG
jgi:hypothetical protein